MTPDMVVTFMVDWVLPGAAVGIAVYALVGYLIVRKGSSTDSSED